ncbi:MAG: response regulator transcription factor [Ignavibacteriaceae bacterium]|nr:response regulator transcription factor [Ignavibacteriaceae bacterium]
MKKIFLVEDDVTIRKGLVEALLIDNYEVSSTGDGDEAFSLIKTIKPDLIILDLMLPGKNGFEICREVRSNHIGTPIIILTSKTEEIDKILGLEIGADDYVTKPFSVRELLARIKAHLRRTEIPHNGIDETSFGNIFINFKKHEAVKNKTQLTFSSMELKIIKFFVEHEGEVISREILLNNVWGFESFPTTRTVDNFILSIRKQIEDNPSEPKHLLTVHKAGYKFVKDTKSENM